MTQLNDDEILNLMTATKLTAPQPAPEVCPEALNRFGLHLWEPKANDVICVYCGAEQPVPPAPERRSSVWHTVHYKCTDCGYQSSAPAQVGEFTNCGNCGSTFLAPQTPAAAPAPQPAAGDESPERVRMEIIGEEVMKQLADLGYVDPETALSGVQTVADVLEQYTLPARIRTPSDRPAGEQAQLAAERLYKAGCGHVMEVSEIAAIILESFSAAAPVPAQEQHEPSK